MPVQIRVSSLDLRVGCDATPGSFATGPACTGGVSTRSRCVYPVLSAGGLVHHAPSLGRGLVWGVAWWTCGEGEAHVGDGARG
jgi:hypothetical protein